VLFLPAGIPALTFARMLLPRQINRSVKHIYAERDFNLSLPMAKRQIPSGSLFLGISACR
jgi:hypothetical protein